MAISLVAHGAVLVWALVTFARPLGEGGESVAVDLIDASQLAQSVLGAVDATSNTPFADKVGETTSSVDDTNAKIDTKEIQAATDKQNLEPAPPKAEEKPVIAPPESKVDPIAEALKKEETKKPEKKVEPPKPQPVKKTETQQPKFDPRKVKDLLDKRQPTRLAAVGPVQNSAPARGANQARAASLSGVETAGLIARLKQRWVVPGNVPQDMKVRVIFNLNKDGTLSGKPEVVTEGSGGTYVALRESAIRAIYASQPFDMLKPWNYENWEEIDVTFKASDLM